MTAAAVRLATLAGAVVLAACSPAVEDAPFVGQPFAAGPYGPGGPPRIGTLDAVIGGEAVARGVHDYSVGAVDPGANGRSTPDGFLIFIIGANIPDPFLHTGEIQIEALLPDLAPGDGPLTLRLLLEGDRDGPRLEGTGQLTLVQVTPPPEDTAVSLYGRIAGRFEASLCPAGGQPPGPCLPAAGTFETAFYENLP